MNARYRGEHRSVTQKPRCRELRKNTTEAELALWRLLRSRQFAGIKFRRQHQFGPYILDFYCPEYRLDIEADGDQHYTPEKVASDVLRTRYLEERGIRVLRFTNLQILKETDGVVSVVRSVLGEPSP